MSDMLMYMQKKLSFGAVIWLYESGGMHDVVTGYIMYSQNERCPSLLTAISLRHVYVYIRHVYSVITVNDDYS